MRPNLFVLALLATSACTKFTAIYALHVEDVLPQVPEKPATIAPIVVVSSPDAIWTVGPIVTESIGLTIENKMATPLLVLWDESSLTDTEGQTHKMMHAGTKFIDAGRSQPPTSIAPNAKLVDSLINMDEVKFDTRDIHNPRWVSPPFLRVPQSGRREDGLKKLNEPIIGKTFQVTIQTERDGKKTPYTFRLKVDHIDVK